MQVSSPSTLDAAEAILAAAEGLFAEHGYEGVSIQQIAERAGVSKANVFHHYSNKEGLYLAVLRASCAKSAPLIEALQEGDGSTASRLAQFAAAHLDHVLQQGPLVRLFLHELLHSDGGRMQQLAEQVVETNFERLVSILAEGQHRGDLRAGFDPAVAALLLLGANVFFFQNQALLRHLPAVAFADDPKNFSRQLADILLHGLLTDPSGDSSRVIHPPEGREER